eukprot:1963141-Pyramimonas_sp.AAC.1
MNGVSGDFEETDTVEAICFVEWSMAVEDMLTLYAGATLSNLPGFSFSSLQEVPGYHCDCCGERSRLGAVRRRAFLRDVQNGQKPRS